MSSRQVQLSSYVSLRDKPIDGPGTCGMEKPLRVAAFGNGGIGLTSAATLSCPVVATTDKWLADIVQPAAQNVLGAQVIEMRAGSYSCRAMNNGTGTSRTSEHAFGNAVDVFSFRLNDGRNITVKDGWRGSPEEQAFLREVFVGACEMFSTVLGPGADAFHYDHLHIDLARHSKGRHICKPIIKYTPMRDLPPPDPARSMALAPLPAQPRYQPAPTQVAGQPARGLEGLRPPAGVNGAYAMASPALGAPRYNTPQPRPYQPSPTPSEMRGPLQLPGSTPPTEEVILGDDEGNGVLDEAQANEPGITPQNDPFAYRPNQPTGSIRRY